MTRKPSLLIQHDEHAEVGGVAGKKVFIIDNAGNQIISFGSATISIIGNVTINEVKTSYYTNESLASGYTFHGFCTPGSNPTTASFRVMRETSLTGEILFGAGTPDFTHQWSVSSLPSISWS